eukprot:11561049-Heterocapsa_arctica.AAC.1
MAQANRERERIEAIRLEAQRQHAQDVDDAARLLREQFQRAEAELHAQRTAAQDQVKAEYQRFIDEKKKAEAEESARASRKASQPKPD